VLLAIPALRALRAARPRDTLVVAAQPRIGRLLEILGVVDRSVDFETLGLDALFPESPGSAIGEWPARCADDLRRATRVVAWVGSREPRFVKRLIELVPGSVVAPSVNAGRPVWEHLVASAAAVEPGTDRALRAPVPVPVALVDEARRELRHLGWDGTDRLLIVHPGAGGQGKRWATSGFAAVLKRLAAVPRLSVAVHQGPADAAAVAALPERLTAAAIRLREPPLPLLAGMLTHAALYVGNDSGISHLAAAVGARSVVLFGPDQLIWRPWARHVETLVVSPAKADDGDIARVVAAITSVLG
jgi:hypothetical protein